MEVEMAVQGDLSQLVTFSLGEEELAFPMDVVQEIVRPPEITKIPGAPSFLDGIANFRGSVMPLIDLRDRLGMPRREHDDDTRVLVVNLSGALTGMIVDRVSEILHTTEVEIEDPPPIVSGLDGQCVHAVAKAEDGRRVVMILAVEKLTPDPDIISGEGVPRIPQQETRPSPEAAGRKEGNEADEEHLVTFVLNDEEFAVNIMQVQEIIRVGELTHVPQAPGYVRGIMSLRNTLLPIVDLRRRLGMGWDTDAGGKGNAASAEESIPARSGAAPGEEGTAEPSASPTRQTSRDVSRIVVINLEGVRFGLGVDSVSEVLRLPRTGIEPAPDIIDVERAGNLHGVGKLDGGKRLLMILNVEQLMSRDEHERLVSAIETREKRAEEVTEENIIRGETQLVCFEIDGEEYGLDIMRVHEIIRMEEITSIPQAPELVEGIVNLRGNILPVLNMCRHARSERTERNRILVVDIEGKTTGVIVDSVSEVLRIENSLIDAPPAVVKGQGQGRYIKGVGKLAEGKRLILIVDADSILEVSGAAERAGAGAEGPAESAALTAEEGM